MMAAVIMTFIYAEVNTQYSIKSALNMVCSGLVMVQVAFLELVPRLAPCPGMPTAALRAPPRVVLAEQLCLEPPGVAPRAKSSRPAQRVSLWLSQVPGATGFGVTAAVAMGRFSGSVLCPLA